jgi:hypothetical protein
MNDFQLVLFRARKSRDATQRIICDALIQVSKLQRQVTDLQQQLEALQQHGE